MSGALLGDIALAAGGLGAGIWVGFRLGVRYGTPPWRYWLMNGGALVVCLGVCALGLALGARWVAVVALGVLAGTLTGLKYGIRGGFVLHPGAPQAAVPEGVADTEQAAGLAAVQAASADVVETADGQT